MLRVGRYELETHWSLDDALEAHHWLDEFDAHRRAETTDNE